MNRALCAIVVCLASAPVGALEVNLASQAELESIAGIGPDFATRVLAARRERPFNDWDDFLQRVRGVGKARAARLSHEGLTVGGSPYPAAAPLPAAPASELRDAAPAAPAAAASALPDSASRGRTEAPATAPSPQPKNAATSSRRPIVSSKPSAINSRV